MLSNRRGKAEQKADGQATAAAMRTATYGGERHRSKAFQPYTLESDSEDDKDITNMTEEEA